MYTFKENLVLIKQAHKKCTGLALAAVRPTDETPPTDQTPIDLSLIDTVGQTRPGAGDGALSPGTPETGIVPSVLVRDTADENILDLPLQGGQKSFAYRRV